MVITATEFKTNFDKYLAIVFNEDIYITKNGKTIAKLINPKPRSVDQLRGLLKGSRDNKDIKEERLEKYADYL